MKQYLDKIEEKISRFYDTHFIKLDFISKLLFFVGLLTMFIYQCRWEFAYVDASKSFEKNILLFFYIVMIIKIFLTKEKIKTYFLFLLMIIGVIIYNINLENSTSLVQVVLLLIGSRKIEKRGIIKFLLCCNLALIIYNAGCYLLNEVFGYCFSEECNYKLLYRNGFLRHSFFFQHPNIFSNYVFWTYMMFVYLNYDKKEKHSAIIFLSFALALFTMVFPNSRNAFLFFVISPFLLILFSKKSVQENRLFKFINKFCFPLFFGISLFFMFTIDGKNILGTFSRGINSFLNNRILIGFLYFKEYGISLFGNLMTEDRNLLVLGKKNLVMDNWYYYLIIRNGIVVTIGYVYIFVKSAINNVKNKNWKVCYFVLIFLAYNFIESIGRGDMLPICFPFLLVMDTLEQRN